MHQTLMLLRHAKAVPWEPGIDDFSRRLNERGRTHAAAVARWFRGNLELPARVLCSPSARTVETLQPLLDLAPSLSASVIEDQHLYLASAGSLYDAAAEALRSVDSVLMVGHNPGFEDLAFSLATQAERRQLSGMATGTLAVFSFPEGFESAASNSRLVHWLTRQDL